MGLTLAQLTQAIKSKVDTTMETHVAESIAEHALGFFGFSNRIIDNALEPTDRNMFYQLQDYDLLTTCLLYTSPSPRDRTRSRMPSSA